MSVGPTTSARPDGSAAGSGGAANPEPPFGLSRDGRQAWREGLRLGQSARANLDSSSTASLPDTSASKQQVIDQYAKDLRLAHKAWNDRSNAGDGGDDVTNDFTQGFLTGFGLEELLSGDQG